jgi:hypothetical protein
MDQEPAGREFKLHGKDLNCRAGERIVLARGDHFRGEGLVADRFMGYGFAPLGGAR